MALRFTLVGVLAAALCAYGQNPGPGRGRFGGGGGNGARFLGAEAGAPGRVVKNAPYSADMITESMQTLPDGNHIRQDTTSRIYRDSEGRTRTEQSLKGLGALAGSSNLPKVVFINDPVAGTNYALNPDNKTASKSAWMRPGRSGPPPEGRRNGGFRGGDGTNAKTETLGQKTIEGVVAEGTRTTMTIPAGRIGNEQPIQVVTERWYSPELQTVVLSKHSDPRSGETVTRLANISRAEPPRSLFEVPSEYKVTENSRGR